MVFEKFAKRNKGKIQFTICDTYLDKECSDMLVEFELEDKKLPFVRILYGEEGQSENYRVFQMSDESYN